MSERPCDDCPHENGCPGFCENEFCWTCRGTGIVNPLTAPASMLCLGATTCPDCEGTGEIR